MIAFVGIFSLIVALIVVAVTLFVFKQSKVAEPNGNAPVYRVRKVYATILILILSITLLVTLGHTPYTAYSQEKPEVQVDVIGRMWSWEFRTNGATAKALSLPQGKVVEFAVTAIDVNHGFGVYNEDGHLIGQTQAMPGYVNKLRMVFEKPGKYRVLCLEYCGLIHHSMLTEFNVQ